MQNTAAVRACAHAQPPRSEQPLQAGEQQGATCNRVPLHRGARLDSIRQARLYTSSDATWRALRHRGTRRQDKYMFQTISTPLLLLQHTKVPCHFRLCPMARGCPSVHPGSVQARNPLLWLQGLLLRHCCAALAAIPSRPTPGALPVPQLAGSQARPSPWASRGPLLS